MMGLAERRQRAVAQGNNTVILGGGSFWIEAYLSFHTSPHCCAGDTGAFQVSRGVGLVERVGRLGSGVQGHAHTLTHK